MNDFVLDEEYILDSIKNLGHRYDTYKVFSDFITISAIAINNSVNYKDEKEQEYLKIINRYDKAEREVLQNMFTALVVSLDPEEFNDVLGKVYEDLNLQNKFKGQFFTPPHLCDFMAKVSVDDNIEEIIKEKGYIGFNEPACGSGRLIYSFLKEMKSKKINYHSKIYIEATDISTLCAYMTYIQLSLYGANAKVVVGNTLSMEVFEILYTPFYYWFPILKKSGN